MKPPHDPAAGETPRASVPDDAFDEPVDDAALEADRGLAELVKRAAGGAPPAADTDRLVRGIQKRLRERSRGKFYADGWSLGRERSPLVLVAVTMLVLAVAVWLALGPTSVSP